MRKLLNKPWFVATLALIALAFVVHSLMPQTIAHKSFQAVAATMTEADEGQEALTPAENSATSRADDLSAMGVATFRRDPFTPSVRIAALRSAGEQARPDLVETVHLSAIWSQSGAVYVLINGVIHQPGDEIGRLKIDSVTADGVWLSHWKGRDLLPLGADFTLNTPAVMANPPLPAL